MNVGVTTSVSENKIMKLFTTVPDFNWKSGSVEQWDKYKNIMNDIDWNVIYTDMNVEEKVTLLFNSIEREITESFEIIVDRKSVKRRNVPKHVKKWYKKKNKISKNILSTKCEKKVVKLIDEREGLEE